MKSHLKNASDYVGCNLIYESRSGDRELGEKWGKC